MDSQSYEEQALKYEDLLRKISNEHQVDVRLIEELIDFEKTKVHLERRRGAKDHIRRTIETWSEETGS